MRPAIAFLLAFCLQLAADTNMPPVSITINHYHLFPNSQVMANVTIRNITGSTLLVWQPGLIAADKSSTTNLVSFCGLAPHDDALVLQPGQSSTAERGVKPGRALPFRWMVKVKTLQTGEPHPRSPLWLRDAGKLDDFWLGPFPSPPPLTVH
jgi:hypothetical protein